MLTDAGFGFYSALNLLKQQNKKAHLITGSQIIYERADQSSRSILSAEKFSYVRGFRRYQKNISKTLIDILSKYIKNDEIKEVWLHEIYSLHWNIAFHYLKQYRPDLKFYLLPDGTFNMFKRPLTFRNKLSQKLLSLRHTYYHSFQGDWYGIGAKDKDEEYLIEKIYLPKNFPHEYDPLRVKEFTFSFDFKKPKEISNKALIIEQSLMDRGYLNHEQSKKIIKDIKEHAARENIQEIYVAFHPKAKVRDFDDPFFIPLTYEEVSLEDHILENGYQNVYSCFSTALLLSSTLEETNFYSIGLDSLKKLDFKDQYAKKLSSMGIHIL